MGQLVMGIYEDSLYFCRCYWGYLWMWHPWVCLHSVVHYDATMALLSGIFERSLPSRVSSSCGQVLLPSRVTTLEGKSARGNPSDPFIGALPSNWWKTKQNHRKLWKFAILTQNLDYFNVSIYSLKIQTNFVQIVLFSGHKHGEKLSFWKLTPLDCSLYIDAKWRDFDNVRIINADGWNCIHCAVCTLRIECRCNFNV